MKSNTFLECFHSHNVFIRTSLLCFAKLVFVAGARFHDKEITEEQPKIYCPVIATMFLKDNSNKDFYCLI